MSEARIPVDLFNPGQVFACLGFLEAADVLLGEAAGAFDWERTSEAAFRLRVNGQSNPFEEVLRFLSEAAVFSVAPFGSENSTEKWSVPTQALDCDAPFPYPDPPSPATLPAVLRTSDGRELIIDHWGDATARDNMKFWAGSGGYPGVALVRDALALIRPPPLTACTDPFSVSANQSSSLRLDWRRDYIPMDAGFSPNEHPEIVMRGYPLVEVLAAIGLTHARPHRIHKLEYCYGVIGSDSLPPLYSPVLMRAALGCTPLPFRTRTFRMRLGWPGQQNQARCITDVSEEPGR